LTWVDATSASLPDGTLVAVSAAGSMVAVARAAGAWHAVDAWCTHAECPLTDGWLEEAAVRCACHGALFDLATGEALEGPAVEPVAVYATRVTEGRVEVDVP
jgi:3-phenylpropionate/trans-cinnamate dioxygenase ferredoxin component